MLAFEKQQRFERWLQDCPLDSQTLNYAVSRCDGLLTVSATWKLAVSASAPSGTTAALACGASAEAPQAAAPSDTGGESIEAAAPSDTGGESIEELRAEQAKMSEAMQAMMACGAKTAGDESFASATIAAMKGGGSPSPQQDMLLNLMRQQLGGGGGSGEPPQRAAGTDSESVRALMSASLGVAFPKPPGASFGAKAAEPPGAGDAAAEGSKRD